MGCSVGLKETVGCGVKVGSGEGTGDGTPDGSGVTVGCAVGYGVVGLGENWVGAADVGLGVGFTSQPPPNESPSPMHSSSNCTRHASVVLVSPVVSPAESVALRVTLHHSQEPVPGRSLSQLDRSSPPTQVEMASSSEYEQVSRAPTVDKVVRAAMAERKRRKRGRGGWRGRRRPEGEAEWGAGAEGEGGVCSDGILAPTRGRRKLGWGGDGWAWAGGCWAGCVWPWWWGWARTKLSALFVSGRLAVGVEGSLIDDTVEGITRDEGGR